MTWDQVIALANMAMSGAFFILWRLELRNARRAESELRSIQTWDLWAQAKYDAKRREVDAEYERRWPSAPTVRKPSIFDGVTEYESWGCLE